jgi:hypothetical protein
MLPLSLRRLGCFVILVSFLGTGTVHANDLDRRVHELLLWVAEETGYEAGGIEVTVAFAEPRVINIVGHGVDYSGHSDIEAVAIGSAILLPDWFQLGRDEDLLVHELTHVLQYANDAQFACQAEQEREAYEVQAAFTDETGIGIRPARWFVLLLHCGTDPWRDDLRR